jgi:chromosome segregation ATPase
MGDRLQQSIEQAVAAPSNAIRQVRDEIPSQVDRAIRSTHDNLRDELDRTTASIHGAVQHDIAQLEQSIASNVTRMAQGTNEAVARVESDVDVLGETVVRFERGVHAEFDRFESQLRGAIERVEQNLREELVEPTETVRKLDDELPSRFGRIERALVEQLQHGQRDMSQVLTSLVDADRAALDRLASLASTLDEDRARRSEDLEVVVDTVTTGWEALAGAVRSLYDQADENSRRLAAIEQRLLQIRDVEGALERTLDEFQRHMRDLKPSPIVVTVSHDEAEVQSRTRAGWTAPEPDATDRG